MARTADSITNDEAITLGELETITGPKVIYTNDSGVYEGLTLGAGESIRRNATDTAFEVYTPSAGGGTPGGNDTEVQFNDGGSFGGDSTFTFNKSTNVLTVASITDGTTTLTGGNLQGVTAINATTKSTIQSAITTLANLTSIQSQTVTFGGTLNVEANSRINQDLTSDATATFAGVTTTGNVGRDTDNYIGFGVDNSLAIKIGGVASAITSISTGTSDNDKLVTQGYVDDNAGGGGGTAPQVQFFYSGEVPVATLFKIPIHTTFTASGVRISAEVRPGGQDFKLHIMKNGTASTNSIVTSDATIDITTAQSLSNDLYQTVTVAIDNGSFTAGDVIYGIVNQQGTTAKVSNLTITVY